MEMNRWYRFLMIHWSRGENKVTCHVAWTNEDTKKVILENIHRSPLYSGQIEGVGPRYWPKFGG